MRQIVARLLSFALACGVVHATGSGVIALTPDDFDEHVGGSLPAFVEFYAPWCGHCKALAPEYDVVGNTFSKSDGVIVAKVDADAHRDLAQQYGVSGYPTLKWFPANSQDPEDYSGGRTADDIVEFINEKTGLRKRIKKEPTAVTNLEPSTFDSIVMDPKKHALVEFYAPWCGHCKALKPTYEEVAKTFENEEDVVVAALDADKHKDIASQYGVSGFPTIKFFPAGEDKEPMPYEGARTSEDFVKFLNKHAATQRKLGGELKDTAGLVEELSDIASEFLASDDKSKLVEEAKAKAKTLSGDVASSAKRYIKAMEKVISKGSGYVAKEISRLSNMIESSAVSGAKKTNFMLRRNVLKAFLDDDE